MCVPGLTLLVCSRGVTGKQVMLQNSNTRKQEMLTLCVLVTEVVIGKLNVCVCLLN